MSEGHWASYEPDFIAHVECGGANTIIVIEVKGEERTLDLEKKLWAEQYWIPAVNSNEDLNGQTKWRYLYIEDPGQLHMQLTNIAGGMAW